MANVEPAGHTGFGPRTLEVAKSFLEALRAASDEAPIRVKNGGSIDIAVNSGEWEKVGRAADGTTTWRWSDGACDLGVFEVGIAAPKTSWHALYSSLDIKPNDTTDVIKIKAAQLNSELSTLVVTKLALEYGKLKDRPSEEDKRVLVYKGSRPSVYVSRIQATRGSGSKKDTFHFTKKRDLECVDFVSR